MSSQAHEAEPRILFVHYDLNQPVGVELWRGIKQTASGFAHPPDLKLEPKEFGDAPLGFAGGSGGVGTL